MRMPSSYVYLGGELIAQTVAGAAAKSPSPSPTTRPRLEDMIRFSATGRQKSTSNRSSTAATTIAFASPQGAGTASNH